MIPTQTPTSKQLAALGDSLVAAKTEIRFLKNRIQTLMEWIEALRSHIKDSGDPICQLTGSATPAAPPTESTEVTACSAPGIQESAPGATHDNP